MYTFQRIASIFYALLAEIKVKMKKIPWKISHASNIAGAYPR